MTTTTRLVGAKYGPGRSIEFIDAHSHDCQMSINGSYVSFSKSRAMPIKGNLVDDVSFFFRNHKAKEEFDDAIYDHIGLTLCFCNFDSGEAIPFQRMAMPDQNVIDIIIGELIESLHFAGISLLKSPVQSTDWPEGDYLSVKSYTCSTLRICLKAHPMAGDIVRELWNHKSSHG